MMEVRPKKVRFSVPRIVAAAGLAVAVGFLAAQPSRAAQPGVVKIAVFKFALRDSSAGGGLAKDPRDAKYLQMATAEARHLLSVSGRYRIVDTGSAEPKLTAAGGVQECNGCEVALARKLGAGQAMVGLVTRVSQIEYTIQILVKDVATGKTAAEGFTGLRMGANYSWPRGVAWLMKNRILATRGR